MVAENNLPKYQKAPEPLVNAVDLEVSQIIYIEIGGNTR